MDESILNLQILKLFTELISQTMNEIDAFHIHFQEKDSPESQLNVGKDILIIHAIATKDNCSMKDIITATGMPNSTATRRVGFLASTGFLMRRISKTDKRKTILKLTKTGKKALLEFFDYMTKKFEKTLEFLDQNEKEVIIKCFNNLLSTD